MLIVGAGIAGAACANVLSSAGVRVRVLDRGRRPGGRMSGKQLLGRYVDVGASYFTVTDSDFAAVVDRWHGSGLARPWTMTFESRPVRTDRTTSAGPLRWAAVHGQLELVAELLGDQDVSSGHTATTVSIDATGPSVDAMPADVVVLAMPDPQAARLLPTPTADSGGAGNQPGSRLVEYEPVLALAAQWPEREWPFADGVFVNDHPRLAFVADDGARRGDGAAVLVAHTTAEFAGAHLDSPQVTVPTLVRDLTDLFGIATQPTATVLHRWSFAKPTGMHPEPYLLTEAGLGFCGDSWCPSGSPRVESAWLSGHRLGSAILDRLGRRTPATLADPQDSNDDR